jgi:hypothetical protein
MAIAFRPLASYIRQLSFSRQRVPRVHHHFARWALRSVRLIPRDEPVLKLHGVNRPHGAFFRLGLVRAEHPLTELGELHVQLTTTGSTGSNRGLNEGRSYVLDICR